MPERYQYPVDEGFADRIHTPEGVRSLVVKCKITADGVAQGDGARRPRCQRCGGGTGGTG